MFANSPISLRPLLILGVCALASACSSITDRTRSFADAVTPYKVEIVQGNFISREQVEVLKPGMSRSQVREILGTPLLQSVFHVDRWDYIFTLKRQGTEPQARQFSVYFKDDVMERAEGDPMPSESEFVTLLGSQHKPKPIPELVASEDQLTRFAAPPAAAASAGATAAVPAAPLPSSYPPLEAPAR